MIPFSQTITWNTPDQKPTEDGSYIGFFWIDYLDQHELRPLSWRNGTWYAGTLPASVSAPLELFCSGHNRFLAWSSGPSAAELIGRFDDIWALEALRKKGKGNEI